MNFKTLMKLSSMLLFMVLMLSGASFAQQTYYVDGVNGLDGLDGLHSTVTGVPGQGPKKTIANAITACSSGDVISVVAGTYTYTENITVNKRITFQSSDGGTVTVNSMTLDNQLASPNNSVTFGGPYKFLNGITLTNGKLLGGPNVTVATSVTRKYNTTVDAQLNFSGAVAFNYVADAAQTMTTGFELPAAGNSANFGSLTTDGNVTLKLNENKSIAGAVTAGKPINLNGYTLTLVGNGADITHAFGGDVTGGTLVVNTAKLADYSGSSPVAHTMILGGTGKLPDMSITTGSATVNNTVNITTTGALGNLTVSGANQIVTVNGATTVGNVNVSATTTKNTLYSQVTLTTPTTVGTVTNTADAYVLLSAATSITSITNSGYAKVGDNGTIVLANSGYVTVATAAAVTVNGNVELNSNVTAAKTGPGSVLFTAATSILVKGNVYNNTAHQLSLITNTADPLTAITYQNYGVISFNDADVTVNGMVQNNAVFTGTGNAVKSGYSVTYNNNGDIRFGTAANDLVIKGKISNNVNSTASFTAVSGATKTMSNNGRITIATTRAATYAAIENTSNLSSTATNSGTIVFAANGNTVTASSITNSSSSSEKTNGTIDMGNTGTGALVVTNNISTTGAAGGSILLPNAGVTVGGSVINARTAKDADINFGTAGTTGAAIAISGDLINSGASKITVTSLLDAGFTVTGRIENSGAGTISFPSTAAAAYSYSFGGMTLTAGTIDFAGTGAATGPINVKNINLTNGTLNLGTGTRTWTVTGNNNVIGDDATAPVFKPVANTNATTLTFASPVPTTQQLITIGKAGVIYCGPLTINNGSGLVEAVVINGGNLRIRNNVTFSNGTVVLNGTNQRLFIGDEVNHYNGNFTNNAGYTTNNNSFVSLNSEAAATVAGTEVFGNFEVDCANGATVNGTFAGTFNLTRGSVAGGASIVFENATSYPTIVRNAGTFAVAPTFNSMVNVYYIGVDKSTSLELPTDPTILNDLTVATTNGTSVSGKGVVTVSVPTSVNGVLTVNAGQALLLDGVDLQMNGNKIVLDGDIVNVAAADELVLNSANGTTITGSGVLPDLKIADGSNNNVINGAKGFITGLLGADKLRGGVGGNADFVASTGTANGSITFDNAATASALTLNLGSAYALGTVGNETFPSHVKDIFLASTNNTLNINANMQQVGSLTHNGGLINVPANVVWTYRGGAISMDGQNAAITGNGTLYVYQPTGSATEPTFGNPGSEDATIAIANVEINLGADAKKFTVNNRAVTLTGTVKVTRGVFDLAQNVTLTGNEFSLTSHSSVANTGVLRLDAAAGKLAFNYTGTPSISNLRVSKDVVLGSTGTALTVTSSFLHDGGVLDFSSRNITIDNGATFTHDSGSYAATTGYLIYSGSSFTQNEAFTIDNLKIVLTADQSIAGDKVVTVSKNLVLNAGDSKVFTIDGPATGVNNTLTLADKATLTYVSGNFDIQPIYAGKVNFTAANSVAYTFPSLLWPTTNDALVGVFKVANTAAITLPKDGRVVNDSLIVAGTLTIPEDGTLTLVNAAPFTMTSGTVTINKVDPKVGLLKLADNSAFILDGGDVTGTGTFTFGNNVLETVNAGTLTVATVNYGTNTSVKYAVAAARNSGKELPSAVKDFTFTRTGNVDNSVVTVKKAVTVNGTLTIKNNLTTDVAAPLTTLGDVVISLDSAYAKATAPVTVFNAALTFSGTANQKVSVPAEGATLGSITLSKANNTNTVTLVGGNLTTGTVNFVNGLFVTGNNVLNIPAPTFGGGQGFNRSGVTGTNVSHVVGNVGKTLTNLGSIATATEPRSEFPVGSLTMYRPVALTFNPNFGVPTVPTTTIVVSHVDGAPTGTVGLPIVNGVAQGINVARYPNFYWNINCTPTSVSPSTTFDLELGSRGFSNFDDINNVRIIRRNGTSVDVSNQWLLQGGGSNLAYDNNVLGGVPSVVVRNAMSGLINGGAMFTLGLKSTIKVVNPIADMNLVENNGTKQVVLSNPAVFSGASGKVTFSAQSSNESVAKVAISGDTLTVTPKLHGSATISVTATDETNDFMTTTFNATVAQISQFAVSGKVVYDNAAVNTLSGVKVTLAGAKTYTATTDANGNYSVANVDNGTYTVTATSAAAWMSSAVSAQDARAAALYLVDPVANPLSALQVAAADVNNDGTVNSRDALLILRRVVKLDSTFAKGDWTFTSKSVTVAGAPVSGADLKGLAVGDANSSAVFTGTLAKANFVNDGSVKVNPGAAIAVPVKVDADNLAALTLKFNYSKELGTFAGVSSKLSGILANESNGVVTIAWADLSGKTAFNANSAEALVTLNFKPTEAFKAGKSFSVDVNAAELVNAEGKVMNAMLKGSTVDAVVPSVFALAQNYPNPFNPTTTISYDLPVNSRVNLVVFNVLGQEVATLVNGVQEAGSYKVQFNAQNLTSGMYIYTLHVTNGDQKFTQTHKMILMK